MKQIMIILVTSLSFFLFAFVAGCVKESGEINSVNEHPATQMKKNANGLVQTQWPSAQDPGLPYYARIEPNPPHLYHNGEYAAIAFYRQPSMIPAQFNLLSMFDVPAAFSVPLHVNGTSLWNGQAGIGSPKIVTSQGNGTVTIWFVPVGPLYQIISSQNALTMGSLSSISGIKVGHATHFQEVNHPHPLPPQLGGGGHIMPKIVLNASGRIEGGGSFQLNLSGHQASQEWVRSTKIIFN